MSNIDNPDASVLKRLYALIYDGLLLVAIDMVIVLLPAAFMITFANIDTHSGGYVAAVSGAILLVHYLFYAWFWTHGGQTLGMRAWRLQLISTNDGSTINWAESFKRFLLGIPAWLLLVIALLDLLALENEINTALILFGLLWWVMDNRAGLWRERLSHARVIQLPKG